MKIILPMIHLEAGPLELNIKTNHHVVLDQVPIEIVLQGEISLKELDIFVSKINKPDYFVELHTIETGSK